jgi:putative ABC transport system permease protein
MELETKIEGGIESIKGEIIGFVPDIKFASFRKAVVPMAFYVWGTDYWGNNAYTMYIRVKAGADKREAISYIRSTLTEFSHEITFNIRFYDDILQRLYEKEIALKTLITLFSIVAIFISIAGVFGLVVFDGECRRKEVGIRKIHGASTMGIIIMFNKTYFKILTICFVIAAPLAWYAVTRWLDNFAYKTPLYWWIYLMSFAVVGIITAATVTFQNWSVVNDNPVKAIKSGSYKKTIDNFIKQHQY